MKIVLINGSHRTPSNCSNFAKSADRVLSNNGHNVQTFNLMQLHIQPCKGCLICEDDESCPLCDDFSTLIEPAIKQADLIVMATPTYFNMPSAAMVNFLNRTNKICTFFSENSKKCIFFLSGQSDHDSIMDAYRCMRTYCDIMEMEEIYEPFIQIARTPDETPPHFLELLKNI